MIAGFWALLAALMTSGAAALVLMSRPLGEAALGFVLVPYVWRLSQHLRALSMARWQNRNPRSAEGRVEYSDAFCRAYYPHVTASAALTLVLVLPFAFSPFLAGGILGLVARAGLEWLELAPRGKRK